MGQRQLPGATVLVDAVLFAALLLRIAAPWATSHLPEAHHRQLSPAQIAQRIGAAYGDAHARVVWARADQTEGPPFHPMYLMDVAGHFHEGVRRAATLTFSATADHLYVWGIRAYEGQRLVWTDEEWPGPWGRAEKGPLP